MRFILSLILTVFCCTIAAQDNEDTIVNIQYADDEHVLTKEDSILPQRWEDVIRQRLSVIAQEADQNYYNTGMCVYDLTDSTIIYAYNQNKRLRPASTEKVLTAVTALDILGARHPYSTEIFAEGNILTDSLNHNILDGNIVVVGDFDPKLEMADIHLIADSIRNLGVDRITGSIIADISMKDRNLLGNGWCWDDEQPYLTPLSIGGSSYEYTNKKNGYDPAVNFVDLLAKEIQGRGIRIDGGTKKTSSHSDNLNFKLPLAKITHSIEEILQRMMKNSDNLYAESMFYQVGANRRRGIGWKDCANEVKAMINRAGGDTYHIEIVDGSGLSLYNYSTPATMVAVLRYAYNEPRIFQVLYPSLPIAGVDGTLSKRMGGTKAANNIHAKTGTVSGVSTLVGYATATNGHILAFAIMNNGVTTSNEGHAFQDRICRILTE